MVSTAQPDMVLSEEGYNWYNVVYLVAHTYYELILQHFSGNGKKEEGVKEREAGRGKEEEEEKEKNLKREYSKTVSR